MELKRGYKQTELGVIPGEWDVVELGNKTVKIGSGITPIGGARNYKRSGRPFLRSQNVGWGSLLLDDVAYIDEKTHSTFSATEIQPGDVLLNITGASIGRCATANASVRGGNVNQHVCIIRPKADEVDSRFLNHFLLSNVGQRQVDSFQAGGNRQGLNFGQIRSFRFPLPPLPEQRAIATALGDVDALVRAFEKLIAKKRDLKQAALQRLLTGQTRLPGYSGEWRTDTFEELFDPLRSANNSRADLVADGEIGYLHYGDIHTHSSPFFDCSRDLRTYISTDKVRLTPLMADGDLVMVDASEDTEAIGKAVEVSGLNGRRAIAGLHTLLLRPKGGRLADGFKGYLQNFSAVREALVRMATGVSVYGISRPNVRTISLALPDIDEQKAIAAVLWDMEAEISALEARLAKTRDLKQGMMQELLTGRTRLV